ncbi:hypothetical protein D9M71_194860 [compost metagenome]
MLAYCGALATASTWAWSSTGASSRWAPRYRTGRLMNTAAATTRVTLRWCREMSSRRR